MFLGIFRDMHVLITVLKKLKATLFLTQKGQVDDVPCDFQTSACWKIPGYDHI